MNIAHLKEFLYLADTLSFKRTAEHFYVSRSVISRHLAAIEEDLGAKLVDRSNHAVKLTEAGLVFYRDAQIVVRDFEAAVDHVRQTQSSQGQIIRLGYLRNAARPIIVHFARYLRQTHPDITLSMTCMEYSDLRRAMDEGLVDVALAVNVNPRISRNYRSTHIYDDRFFAVMSTDHPLAQHTQGISLDDLPEDKLLLPDSFVYSGLSELIDGIVDNKTQLVAREYYRDIDMLSLKVQTEGYVALSSSMNNVLFGDRLAIVPLLGPDTTFSVSAFYANVFTGDAFAACREAFEHCRDTVDFSRQAVQPSEN